MIVIDASLAVKWYIDEPLSDEAEELLAAHVGTIAVPGIFLAEVIGALVRRANSDKAMRSSSEQSIAQFGGLIDEGWIAVSELNREQFVAASQLALDLGHPLKDCLYLALAMDLECPLVTCDTKFAEKARRSYAGVQVLGEP